MQRKRNLFLTLVLMILCMGIHSIAASASDNLDGQIVDGSLLTHDIESKDTKVLMPQSLSDGGVSTYGAYLATGTTHIMNEGNGVVYISGETSCLETCSSVKVNLYLERLVNGSWQTVTTRSHTANNTYYTSYGISLAVKTGYYYRVVGVHSATKNGVTESTSTATSGLYIG